SANYTLSLVTSDGKTLRPSELALTHTRKLHLLLIDPSLEDYQHIHPEPVDDSGEWTFSFTPKRPGTYKVFAEFVPAISLRQVIGEAEITAPGAPTIGMDRGLKPYSDGEYIYSLSVTNGPMVAGTDATLHFMVERKGGGVVNLEPVMGAMAHLAAFDVGRNGYAHLHPSAFTPESTAQRPELSFAFNTQWPGRYRVWGQVMLDGRQRFVPFDVEVAAR
ncbi:MAG: hypothetical protein ABSH19_02320, partial [Opitutales bacterium]